MTKFKKLAITGVTATAILYGVVFTGLVSQRNKLAPYQLDVKQVQHMAVLDKSMRRHDMAFDHDLKPMQISACMVRYASSRYSADEMAVYDLMFEALAQFSKQSKKTSEPDALQKHNVKYENAVFNAARHYDLDYGRSDIMAAEMIKDVEVCGLPKAHNGVGLNKLVKLKPHPKFSNFGKWNEVEIDGKTVKPAQKLVKALPVKTTPINVTRPKTQKNSAISVEKITPRKLPRPKTLSKAVNPNSLLLLRGPSSLEG